MQIHNDYIGMSPSGWQPESIEKVPFVLYSVLWTWNKKPIVEYL